MPRSRKSYVRRPVKRLRTRTTRSLRRPRRVTAKDNQIFAPLQPGFTRAAGMYGRFGPGPTLTGQVEQKFRDASISLTSAGYGCSDSAGTGGIVYNISTGGTASDRIGAQIVVTQLLLAGYVTLPASTIAWADDFWIYVILDTQCNGEWSVPGDVFIHSGPMGSKQFNLENSNRFRILKVLHSHLESKPVWTGAAVYLGGDSKFLSCEISCNIPIIYANNTGGAITDVKQNNISLIWGSSQGVCTFLGNMRVRYTDM